MLLCGVRFSFRRKFSRAHVNPICRKQRRKTEGFCGRQALYRDRRPRDQHQSRECFLEGSQADCRGAECCPVGSSFADRQRTPARQPILCHSLVRSRLRSEAEHQRAEVERDTVSAMTEREEMQSEARHLRESIRKCWAELDKPELTPEERTKIREQVSALAAKLGHLAANMK